MIKQWVTLLLSYYFYSKYLELSAFLKALEERSEKKKQESTKHINEKIKRVDGSLRHSFPPDNTPLWCIDSDWIKGLPLLFKYHYLYCMLCRSS